MSRPKKPSAKKIEREREAENRREERRMLRFERWYSRETPRANNPRRI
jgi:hypothetical protein